VVSSSVTMAAAPSNLGKGRFMRLIEWQNKFNTGIPAVDFEHKELVKLVNEALQRLEKIEMRDKAAETLGEIHAKIAAHFALEERIMRDVRYLGYGNHKADHENLLDDIRDIMDMHAADLPIEHAAALAERLSEWFTRHFRTEDAKFHTYMRNQKHD